MKIVKRNWGIEKWIINTSYCGKVLIIDEGEECNMHYHKIKDETFYVSRGCVTIEMDGTEFTLMEGDMLRVPPMSKHKFIAHDYSEIIEFSTHHEDSDSYEEINVRDEPNDN